MATLRVSAPDVDLDWISAALCVQPTISWRKGDRVRNNVPDSAFRSQGSWHLELTPREPISLASIVDELLLRAPASVATWREVTSRYDVDLFCGLFMSHSNEGEEIEVRTMEALSSRGIRIGLDIYAP